MLLQSVTCLIDATAQLGRPRETQEKIDEMPTASTYLGFGFVIACVGIALILFHIRSNRRHRTDKELSEQDRAFFARQYARRMQTSALLACLGALIGGCGYSQVFEDSPIFATFYVIGMLLLAVWLILLAISDALATRVYASRLNRESHNMQKSLEQALTEVREAHGLDTNEIA